MKHMLFFGQAAFVVTLGAIISPPQISQAARPVNMWRPNGPLAPRPEFVAADIRVAYQESVAARERAADRKRGSTRRGEAAATRVASGNTSRPYGALIAGITGRARNALSQPVPFAELVLRSLETGQVVAETTADENGEFSFTDLSPTGYVVELIGADGSVIAASEMVAATSGGSQMANIRLSGNGTPRAVFGGITRVSTNGRGSNAMSETASEAIARAAQRGTTQTQQPETTASPRL
jgi:hypothetical protein